MRRVSNASRPFDIQIAVLEERLVGRDTALRLQADEYERRLSDLNHAHAAAIQKNADYLPRDVHDRDLKEILARISMSENELIAIRSRSNLYFSVIMGILAAIGAVIALLNYLT